MIDFSVTIAVYKNDNVEFVRLAIESILNQTYPPKEIIITQDGPVSDTMSAFLNECIESNASIKLVTLPQNQGLGIAHRVGIEHCQYEYVAIMDSDDLAAPNRFELQMRYIKAHPEIDVLGGQIEEFIYSPATIVGTRVVPLSNDDILVFLKSRCPFNHVTVMLKKDSVLKAGNYKDWHYNEDYYLWIRMALAGCQFANLPETLVHVRVGKEMYQRRGGWKYFKSERGIQRYMLQHKMISFPRYCYNVLGRFVVQVLMTNRVRGFVFQKLFRK